MVEQGDIIRIDFDPVVGHEQAGHRPGIVISRNSVNNCLSKAIVCPITSTDISIDLHIKLDGRTKTQGYVMCEQMKMLDIASRSFGVIEKAPPDIVSLVCRTCQGIIDWHL